MIFGGYWLSWRGRILTGSDAAAPMMRRVEYNIVHFKKKSKEIKYVDMILYKSRLIILIFLSICISSCADDECSRFVNEVYSTEINPKINEIIEILPVLHDGVKMSEINNATSTKYRFTTIASLSKAVCVLQVEDKINKWYLKYRIVNRNENCEFASVEIDTLVELTRKEWEAVEDLIYKYNYWTANEFDVIEAADGYGLIIEGYRPDAAKCNKRTNQIVYRGSPDKNDSIGEMFNQIDSLMWIKYRSDYKVYQK